MKFILGKTGEKNRKLLRLALILSCTATISSCETKSQVQTKLLGSWTGISGKGNVFSWCITFQENNKVNLKTRKELVRTEESSEAHDYEITEATGTWTLRPGKRLRFENMIVNNQQRNIKKIAQPNKSTTAPLSNYIIDSISKNTWRYRSQDKIEGEVLWFESTKVSVCPDKFNVPPD